MKDSLNKRKVQILILFTIVLGLVLMSWRIYQGMPVTPVLRLQTIEIAAESPTPQASIQGAVIEIPAVALSAHTQLENEEPPEMQLVQFFDISEELYIHQSGIFQLYPPAGWSAVEEEKYVKFSSPDESTYLEVRFANLEQVLDQESFDRFIAAREEYVFEEIFIYAETILELKKEAKTNPVVVSKHILVDDMEFTVISFYLQEQEGVFVYDYWLPGFRADVSESEYQDILEKFDIQRGSLSITGNSLADTIHYISDDYSLDVPLGWAHTFKKNEISTIDTFTSPDLHAAIHILVYDDGEPLTNVEAGEFTLTLLEDFVTDEIVITENFVHQNGGEYVAWNSQSDQGQYQGITQIFNRDEILVVTFYLVDDSHQEIFKDVFPLTLENIDINTGE